MILTQNFTFTGTAIPLTVPNRATLLTISQDGSTTPVAGLSAGGGAPVAIPSSTDGNLKMTVTGEQTLEIQLISAGTSTTVYLLWEIGQLS